MANQARTADVSDREVHRNAQGQAWRKPTTSLEANPEMRLRERIDKANRAKCIGPDAGERSARECAVQATPLLARHRIGCDVLIGIACRRPSRDGRG
jgi:hypothetical protein